MPFIAQISANFRAQLHRSAFSGLLQLGEYETCVEALTKESPSSLHWLADYHNADNLTARTFFEHWSELHEASQATGRSIEVPWGGLIYNGTAREALVNAAAREQLMAYLKVMPIQDRSPESLSLMAELLPLSAELRACLIETMKMSERSFHRNDIVLEAQRIYAEQFGGDQQALDELHNFGAPNDVTSTTQRLPSFLYALAVGWPDDPVLRSLLQQEKLPQLPIPVVLVLCGINGNAETALACIDKMIEISMGRGWPLSARYMQGLRKWAFFPSAESLLKRLISDSDCSRSITAIRLLSTIGKLNDVDRVELIQKFNEQLEISAKSCPDGVDLLAGKTVTLSQAIMSVFFIGAD